jgi:hypothetical protein
MKLTIISFQNTVKNKSHANSLWKNMATKIISYHCDYLLLMYWMRYFFTILTSFANFILTEFISYSM